MFKIPWKELAFQPKPWGTSKIAIAQPPIIVDNSEVLFTPLMKDKWIKITGKLLHIEDFYWTYYSLTKALAVVTPERFPDYKFQFAQQNPGEYLMRISSLPANYEFEISDFFRHFVEIDKFNTACVLYFNLSKMPKTADIAEEHASFNLQYNYYPTEKELIDNLNSLTVEHIHKFIDRQTTDFKVENFFTMDAETKICSFKATPHYSVTLSTYLLNLLQLYNTYESNTAKSSIRLMSGTRTFLNVYCDLIIPHQVNSEEETLLRVINNTARQDEKVMVTLDYLHYYPISRRFINNIRLYITDSLGIPLVFTHLVSYLLHFRQCQPT